MCGIFAILGFCGGELPQETSPPSEQVSRPCGTPWLHCPGLIACTGIPRQLLPIPVNVGFPEKSRIVCMPARPDFRVHAVRMTEPAGPTSEAPLNQVPSSRLSALWQARALALGRKLKHRGPDGEGVYCSGNNILVHERLAVVDVLGGRQPLFARDDNSLVLIANGEIYNHDELLQSLEEESAVRGDGTKETYRFSRSQLRTKSDCEVLLHMYLRYGSQFLSQKRHKIRGMFAFVLLDERKREFIVARDAVGIIPLYYGLGRDGSLWISSEMKAFVEGCPGRLLPQLRLVGDFPPGHLLRDSFDRAGQQFRFEQFFASSWEFVLAAAREDTPEFLASFKYLVSSARQVNPAELRKRLEDAVLSHLMSDVPVGVMLSGGVDSSLVAAIVARHFREQGKDPRSLHTFSVGLEGSRDLQFAKRAAAFLGTTHHTITFSVAEGLAALGSVVWHMESFTTICRTSAAQYLMAKYIAQRTNIKVVLGGEGADEVFGGYESFHTLTGSSEVLHRRFLTLVKGMHHCMGVPWVNKAMMAWGIEARVPFLDSDLLEFAFSIDAVQRMPRNGCEKYLLRQAFDLHDERTGLPLYLPSDVLWRGKEKFFTGIGLGWVLGVQEHAARVGVSDHEFALARSLFPSRTPQTKEEYLYRKVFWSLFGNDESIVSILAHD